MNLRITLCFPTASLVHFPFHNELNISSPSSLNYSESLLSGLCLEYEHCSALKLSFYFHLEPVCKFMMHFQQCRKQEMMRSIRLQHYGVTSCKQRHLIVKHHQFAYRCLTGGFLFLRIFSIAISVRPHVCFC